MHAAMDELCLQNQTLEDNDLNIQQLKQEATFIEEMEVMDHQPFSDLIWEELVFKGFKSPFLEKFDGHSDHYEYAAFINTHMVIIRVLDSLKYMLFFWHF